MPVLKVDHSKSAKIDAKSRESPRASSSPHKTDDSWSETISNGNSVPSVTSSDLSEAADFMSVTEDGSVLEPIIEATLRTDKDEERPTDFWTSFVEGRLIMDPAEAFVLLKGSASLDASFGSSHRKGRY